MRDKSFNILISLVLAVLPVSTWAVKNRVPTNLASRSSIGSATVPVTNYRRGLHPSPNPIDRSSNLVVTGNVGGGKHFRGLLPYNAISDFGGRLGSSTLDSFLRSSSISQDYYRYSPAPTPYYSHTATFTHTVPGTSVVRRPPSSKIRTQASDLFTPSQRIKVPQRDTDELLRELRHLPVTDQQREMLTGQAEGVKARKLAEQRYETKMREFDSQLKEVSEKVDQLQQELVSTEKPKVIQDKTDLSRDINQLFRTAEKDKQKSQEGPQKLDIYEQMQQELEQYQQTYTEEYAEAKKEKEKAEKEKEKEKRKEAEQESLIKRLETRERSLEYKQAPKRIKLEEEDSDRQDKKPRLEDMSKTEITREAEKILGEYGTFAAFNNDRYNKNLIAAEDYLKQGKFYRAADAYTIAAIYKPDDPLVYAGKSHALFAAGEYLSSALFLSMAMEMFPEYAKFKIDVVSMIGSIDTVEKRIVDIKEWHEISKAPELQFLLAYIYLQLDRLERAKQAIDAAHEILPQAPAVITLKKAIDLRTSQ